MVDPSGSVTKKMVRHEENVVVNSTKRCFHGKWGGYTQNLILYVSNHFNVLLLNICYIIYLSICAPCAWPPNKTGKCAHSTECICLTHAAIKSSVHKKILLVFFSKTIFILKNNQTKSMLHLQMCPCWIGELF